MNHASILKRSTTSLDEATENLTFDAFQWSFEETWTGVGWALNALHKAPYASLDLIEEGLPIASTLSSLLATTPHPPSTAATVVSGLEALRQAIDGVDDPNAALTARQDQVVRLVFDAWALHDDCGERLGLEDDRLGENGLVLTQSSPGRVGSKVLDRRNALKIILAGSVVPLAACRRVDQDNSVPEPTATTTQTTASLPAAPLKAVTPLRGTLWTVTDPFLFCAYHDDRYPAGNGQFGPNASLEGRQLGRDFGGEHDWRMYHGMTVPGFPRHPHRGFETVTVVRSGLLDHSDSIGATARYGGGDVQWLTSGRGIQHAEMFPLVHQDKPNPLNLYQIWLNLPARDKMVDPHFTMLWSTHIPRITERDDQGRQVLLTVMAGHYNGQRPPAPPPNSWASRPEAEVAIWTLKMAPEARFTLPSVSPGTKRSLYIHSGAGIRAGDRDVPSNHRVEVDEPGPVTLQAGPQETEILLLQGRPIGEPVAKRGPFVMNTQDEIRQAYIDYRRTQFGGWPWQGNGPVHDLKERFALRPDGRLEKPPA
ncbi:MAG: pirin-like C-terminal cupin domain-containing protein [Myxococcota bacterium]